MPELDDWDTGVKDALYANIATPLHIVVASQLGSQCLQSVHQVVTMQQDWDHRLGPKHSLVTSSMNIYQSLIRLSFHLSMPKLSQLPPCK